MPSWLTLCVAAPVGELSAVALERELRRANRWTLIKAEGLDAAVAGTLDPRFVVAWELVRLLAGTAITGVALALSLRDLLLVI
jgi:hypothetical protein